MLKGHSVIELTDVNTGEVERYEDDNIVTNGLKFYITPKLGTQKPLHGKDIWKEYFSGIKLFGSALKENVNTVFTSTEIELAGYAGVEANTSDNKRGLLNLSESGVLEDRSGIKLVWDFAQNQANGTIACIGITPNEYVKGGDVKLERFSFSSKAVPVSSYPIDYDVKKRMLLAYKNAKRDNLIYFYKISFPIDQYGICDESESKVCEEVPLSVYNYSNYTGEAYFIGEKNGKYYFLAVKSYDTTSEPHKTFFSQFEVDKETHTLTITEFQFAEETQPKFHFAGTSIANSFILNDELFLCATNSYFVLDFASHSYIKLLFLSEGYSVSNYIYIRQGEAIGNRFIIDAKRNIHYDRYGGINSDYSGVGVWVEDIFSIHSRNSYSAEVSTPPYLFTVNNLSSPVTKTADKTMKITYILKEVYPETAP